MFCLNHFAQLGRMSDALTEHDTTVLAIGGSELKAAKRVSDLFESPVPVLADPTRSTYLAYGFTKVARLIQRSGTVLVERTGVIRYLHRSTNPQSSLKKDELWSAVRAVHGAGQGS
jgi:peroxiredoxin